MRRNVSLSLLALVAAFAFSSCMGDLEKKPVGPVSETSQLPWNTAIPGQGGGQLGQMPQNQYRR
jgi:hypothetical protein